MAGRQRQLVLLTQAVRRYNGPDGSAFHPRTALGRRQLMGVQLGRPVHEHASGRTRCPPWHDAGVPTHVALLRGVNNLGSKKITMAELRQAVSSLGHASVMTYIQSGNVLFTPRPAGDGAPGHADAAALAAGLERAIAAGTGVRARRRALPRGPCPRRARQPVPGSGRSQAAACGVPARDARTRPGRLGSRRRTAGAGQRQPGPGPGARPHGLLTHPGRIPAQRTAARARQGRRTDLTPSRRHLRCPTVSGQGIQ